MLTAGRENLSVVGSLRKGSVGASPLERREVHNLFCGAVIVVCADRFCLERGVPAGELQGSLSSLNAALVQ